MILNLITRPLINCRELGMRQLHVSRSIYAAQQSHLYKLRQKTGLAYNLCREALNKHDNNVDEAEAWLKAQALAHGLQKATKVGGRNAKEGLICLSIEHNNRMASLLELNCETDFVAKNDVFKDFALDLTERFATMKQNCTSSNLATQNFLQVLTLPKDDLDALNMQVAPLITKLGENIKIQRAQHYTTVEEDVKIFGQIHAQVSQKSNSDVDILTGRFGALVALRDVSQQVSEMRLKALNAVGQRLCKHVIGYSPTYIELPDNIRKHLEDAEKEQAELNKKTQEARLEERDESEEHSDSENSYQTPEGNHDDWPSIMDQTLIMSDDMLVREFCKQNEISLLYFNRFECGEQS